VHPSVESEASLYEQFPAPVRGQRRLLIYQCAAGSIGMVDWLLTRPEPKGIVYHNLTPAEFYDLYDRGAASNLREARAELARYAPAVSLAIADSHFNAGELKALGVERVTVIPPYLGPRPTAGPDPRRLRRIAAGKRGLDLLFVGRLVPNKGHAHLIRAVAALRAALDPGARLFLVGPPGPRAYVRMLRQLVERLCPGAVIFTGAVDSGELAAHFVAADCFLCLSEHEGYGIPLVEAMREAVPVVAYDAGAVAETLGGAGVLLRSNDPLVVAETVARIVGDAELRRSLVARQAARVAELEDYPRDEAIVAAVREVLG
jgi:glycosyltransferase involved in cell wall biosynthesis